MKPLKKHKITESFFSGYEQYARTETFMETWSRPPYIEWRVFDSMNGWLKLGETKSGELEIAYQKLKT